MEIPLTLLWIDLRVDQTTPVAREQLCELFAVADCGYTESVGAKLRSNAPDAMFVDFDYPDRAGLRLLQELKLKYPSIPILMATIQHSEELAVWAFRSGLLDFFVKPVPTEELRRCQIRIRQIVQQKRRQRSRSASHAHLGNAVLPLEAAPARSSDMRALAPALHYVSQNFQHKILRNEAAALCAMNPFQFSRRFKEVCGVPFREFVVRHRIQEACRLLENPAASITSVAFAVGFNDVGYFSRMFKHHTGATPSALKNELERKSLSAYVPVPDDPASLVAEATNDRLIAMPPLPGN